MRRSLVAFVVLVLSACTAPPPVAPAESTGVPRAEAPSTPGRSTPSGPPRSETLDLDHACWETADGHLRAALEAVRRGDEEEAALEYRFALRHEPGSVAAAAGLARAAERAGSRSVAARALALWKELDREDPEPALRLARLSLARDDDDAARRLALEALRRDPRAADGHYLLGRVHFRAGDLAAALTALQAAVTEDPGHGHAFNLLGLTRLRAGDPAQAAASLRVAAMLLPEVGYVHENLGVALEELRHVAEATRAYRTALELAPERPRARAGLERLMRVAIAPAREGGVAPRVSR